MAKSKSGGTRSYIRGRVGADVYSIGKDSSGKKQQVVRSLAETVANPQTLSQMRGRMIMSTVMQAESALAFIVDHSFDGVPNGQPSLSEFIRKNYGLVKSDVAAHPSSGNSFGLVAYQQKGFRHGAYQISAGNATPAANIAGGGHFPQMKITVPATITAATLTVGVIKTALGLKAGDFVTGVYMVSPQKVAAIRVYMPADSADETVVTAANFATLFAAEYVNCSPEVNLDSLTDEHILSIVDSSVQDNAFAFVTSVKTEAGWTHNTAVMECESNPTQWTADIILPTYPIGQARFLNGGEV